MLQKLIFQKVFILITFLTLVACQSGTDVSLPGNGSGNQNNGENNIGNGDDNQHVDPVDPVTPAPADPVVDPAPAPTDPVVDPTPAPTDPVVDPTPAPTDPVVDPIPAPTDPVDPAPSPINYIPAATNDTATTLKNVPVNINVLANDTGLDDGSLRVAVMAQSTNGTAIVKSNNTITYTPNTGFNGSDSFSYQVKDKDNDTAVATVSIAITCINCAIPIATNDTATTERNVPVNINVLANDTGLDDGSLQVAVMAQSTNGTAVVKPNNTLTYTPNTGFSGADSFSYQVKDKDNDMATATVSIEITCTTCATPVILSLAWDPNADQVDGYRVYFGGSATTADNVISDTVTPAADFDAQVDLSLQAGDTACFRLKAYNSAGDSGFSDAVCTTI